MRRTKIIAEAQRVFGDQVKAGLWLQRPNRAVGGVTPLSLLNTGQGRERVRDILGRIEHGIHG